MHLKSRILCLCLVLTGHLLSARQSAEGCFLILNQEVITSFGFDDLKSLNTELSKVLSVDTAVFLGKRAMTTTEKSSFQSVALFEEAKKLFNTPKVQTKKLKAIAVEIRQSGLNSLLESQQKWLIYLLASRQKQVEWRRCMEASDYPPGVTTEIVANGDKEFILKLHWNPGESDRPLYVKYVRAFPHHLEAKGAGMFFYMAEVEPFIGLSQRFRKEALDDVRISVETNFFNFLKTDELSPDDPNVPSLAKELLGRWEVTDAFHKEPKAVLKGFGGEGDRQDWLKKNFVGEEWTFEKQYLNYNGDKVDNFLRTMYYSIGDKETFSRSSMISFGLKNNVITYITKAPMRDRKEVVTISGNVLKIKGITGRYGYTLKRIKDNRLESILIK